MNRWEQGDGYVLFSSDYSFAPVRPIRWERRVLSCGGAYWLLQDVLTGEPETTQVEQNFQFEADVHVELDGQRTVATAPNGARLLLVPLDGGLKPSLTIGDKTPHVSYWPKGSPSDVLRSEDGYDQRHGRGWTGRSGSRLLPAPAVTYTGQARLPATLTLLIVPLPAAGGDVPAVDREAVSYTHLRAHETPEHLVCRLLLEKKNTHLSRCR